MGHQVSVAFPKNITLLESFRAILVHEKSFLNTFYQLTDSTTKKNCGRICLVRDAIYAEVLVQSKKYTVRILKIPEEAKKGKKDRKRQIL